MLAFGFIASDAVPTRIALIGVASLTDFLDGWLARRAKVASRFGALLDPVADRFFVVGVVVAYVIGHQLSAWQAVAIMFRDVMSVIGFFVARNVSWLRPIAFTARPMGKVVTTAQLLTFSRGVAVPLMGERTCHHHRRSRRDRNNRLHAHVVARAHSERIARVAQRKTPPRSGGVFSCGRIISNTRQTLAVCESARAFGGWAKRSPSVLKSDTSLGLSSGKRPDRYVIVLSNHSFWSSG